MFLSFWKLSEKIHGTVKYNFVCFCVFPTVFLKIITGITLIDQL